MPRKEEFTFPSFTGKDKIHVCLWSPDEGEPRAVLQIAHGIAEYANRYDAFARFLADRGFAVVANDHLGHGESVGENGCLGYFADEDGWNKAVEDLHTLHRLMADRFQDAPYVMMGHSMGSFLVRTYIIRYPHGLDGCILSGTGWQSPAVCDFGRAVADAEALRIGWQGRSGLVNALCFGAYNKRCKPHRTKEDWLSRDPVMVDKYIADPLCGFVPTVSLIKDMLGGIKFICTPKNLMAMDHSMPVYFFSGDADPVGDYGNGVMHTYRAFRKAGMSNVRLKLYPGGRHEMLNEINRDQVYRDVTAWLENIIELGKDA
jgi:alpha-beta hydrolase superfamily lysophospholipase